MYAENLTWANFLWCVYRWDPLIWSLSSYFSV